MRLPIQLLSSVAGVAALGAVLVGCGGSSSSQTDILQLLIPQNVAPGQSIGLGVTVPTDTIQSVSWRQVGGPSVVFHATRSKMIGFDVPSAGSYSFEATVSTAQHGQITQTLSFTAQGTAPLVNVRLDRAIPQRSSASLRVWHGFGGNMSVTYRWQQTAGPAATLTQTDQALLLLDAPAVSSDTLLKFQATATASDGRVASDEAWVLVESTYINQSAMFWQAGPLVTGPVHAYAPGASHAAALERCVYSNNLLSPCTFGTLPLVAQETTAPSIADVMNRTVVSHDWMGRRFQEFLTNADPGGDIRRLLRPVTAVVISADVRPSFYWAGTGAIYLDPEDLWQTPDERDTILEVPDFRSNFDKDLQFVMPWRAVLNNDYASYYYPPEYRDSRPLGDSSRDLAYTVYHELAHAGDFIPPSMWSSLTSSQTPDSAAGSTTLSSDALTAAYPLSSQEMRGLASVAFAGTTATAAQIAYQPANVAGFFMPDRAADFYSYSDPAEDLAQLFSFLMLRYRYGIDLDIAVSNHPQGSSVSGRDYIVTWGERNRIGEDRVKQRVRFAAQRVLPELDVNAALASIPAPQFMHPGVDWVTNIDLGGASALGLRPGAAALLRAASRPVETLPHHAHRPPLRRHFAATSLP
jgi:hypothetical protein